MKAAFWLTGALFLTACSAGDPDSIPDDVYVKLIERKLAEHPCVGNLAQWERNYRYARRTGISAYTADADFDVIEFHLRRAGTTTIIPGRNVMRRGELDGWPDGKYIRFIDGRYKIGENRMQLSRCAPLQTSK